MGKGGGKKRPVGAITRPIRFTFNPEQALCSKILEFQQVTLKSWLKMRNVNLIGENTG